MRKRIAAASGVALQSLGQLDEAPLYHVLSTHRTFPDQQEKTRVILGPAEGTAQLRARLRALFDKAIERGALLVCAPYGCGKTTALAAYAAEKAALYGRIEPQDSLLAFLTLLVHALAPRVPGLEATLAGAHERALQAPDPAAALATWFSRHLSGHACTIVVDDLHNARNDRVARFLAHAIERCPRDVRWIVGSETLDDLPLASWLAHETVAFPIQEDALMFTPGEALEVAALLAPHVEASDILRLHRLTAGVPASFAFAVKTAAAVGLEGLLAAEPGDLAARMLSVLSEPKRRVAVATSALPSLSADAVAYVGGTAALETLAHLRGEAPYLFEAGGSRYHSAIQLLLNAEREASPQRSEIELLTAGALERAGDIAGALRHLQACADERVLAEFLDRHGFAAIESDHWYVVRDAAQSLGETVAQSSPAAMTLLAQLSDFEGRLDVSESLFQNALRACTSPLDAWRIKFWYGQSLIRRGRGNDALALLQPEDELLALPAKLRVALTCVASASHASEERFDLARPWADRALEIVQTLDDPVEHARARQQLAYIALRTGRPALAKASALEAAEQAERAGAFDVGSSALTVAYNVLADEEEDYEGAVEILQRIAMCAAKAGSVEKQFYALAAAYEIAVERGDARAAASLEAEMRQFEVQYEGKHTNEGVVPAHVLQLAWHGDFGSALRILKPSVGEQREPARLALRWSEIAVYAAGAGRADEAELALTEAQRVLDSIGPRCALTFRAMLFSALALVSLGRCAQGKSLARRCLLELAPERAGLRALASAILALAAWRTERRDARGFIAALDELRDRQLGGYARLFEALPPECVAPVASFPGSAIA